jgi:hypothetical protein
MKTKPEKFSSLMERLARRHGIHTVFSDFLTMSVCALSMGRMEEQYLKTVRKYEKPEAYTLSEAFGALVIEMTGDGTGMVDVLGTYFEENLSYGKNGQFFTPQPICDMMARMNLPVKPSQRVLDPACGSGRMLMAMGKLQRFATFFGADNDHNCAMMATINLCLNGMFGEVSWMNSLTNQYYGGWEIFPSIKGCPAIRQISEKESLIHLKLPEYKQKPVPELPLVSPQQIPPQQQLLFEF